MTYGGQTKLGKARQGKGRQFNKSRLDKTRQDKWSATSYDSLSLLVIVTSEELSRGQSVDGGDLPIADDAREKVNVHVFA